MRRFSRFTGGRKGLVLVLLTLVAVYVARLISGSVGLALMPPPPPDQNLQQFKVNRSLGYYIENINILIEPSSSPCPEPVPVIVMVTSAPAHQYHREVIRNTWGKHQPTYFFVGLSGSHVDEQLVDTYIEAKQHRDLIVFDLQDHYQNLTLKVGLMLHWTLRNCRHADFMFKTDDDVMVNPWSLAEVIKVHSNADLLGYKKEGMVPHRDEYTKWYLPRWLYPEDLIPEYLSGTGYLIKGRHVPKILTAALNVPLINMEDIYFTYLVSRRTLGLTLSHDKRLSPYKPILPFSCAYQPFASIHSVTPDEVVRIWPKIHTGQSTQSNCWLYWSSEVLLHQICMYCVCYVKLI